MYAEAQRQVRHLHLPAGQLAQAVELAVEVVLNATINLTPELDPITEPTGLRRSDGVSVDRHTGADHYTSRRLLDAEQQILDVAGETRATGIDPIDLELSVMATETNGIKLNDGQRHLVVALATDPHQVALALAPAGSGKTTAMKALVDVWRDLGHDAIGLAPSAAAAAVLAEATGMATETLAKLDHLIASGDAPIRPGTLVVIDEAGMADTLTLARVIDHCTNQGGRVRLVGDDQQLAAVGAGGVLRDIANTYGAARLEEVVRFTDPTEAAASLDLRDGNPAAFGFYLDHDRIHTGATDTCVTDTLAAWQAEQANGRDCLMLAPTRDLVARLNHDARDARLGGHRPESEIPLRDGNHASVGDPVITRQNDRRLRVSATDWVRNGDRWQVAAVGQSGSLDVRHVRTRLRMTLPPEYVAEHVDLGYAATVHAAQGITADVMHGILTGSEDRQLLYTMLTRGRSENHLHLALDRPEASSEQFLPGIAEQLTAIEVLDRIVTRDGAAVSASSTRDAAHDPATLLHQAASRYADAVTRAAHQRLGASSDDALEAAGPGPLPWLPGIPTDLHDVQEWSTYLDARADRVRDLTAQVLGSTPTPPTFQRLDHLLDEQLRNTITVWRAANGVPDDDHRLLGQRVSDLAADRYGRHLQRQIDASYPPAIRAWEETIGAHLGYVDEHTLDLAQRLEAAQRYGLNATLILQRALAKPLPDDKQVEALSYRVRGMVTQWKSVDSLQAHRAPTRPGAGLEF